MPYIIRTLRSAGRSPINRDEIIMREEGNQAVATHFEARESAALEVERATGGDPDYEEMYTDAQNVSSLGDSFGPLANGTIIEVRFLEWHELYSLSGAPVELAQVRILNPSPKHRIAIIDAYNNS